jgi:N-hydroxyarylamine O-acetyltransferase
VADDAFDQDAWLARIGYAESREPTLATLCAVVQRHASSIAYESIDVLLGRPPKLDVPSLLAKMVRGRRGGYCFEQNMLFRAGLRSLGFAVTSLQARVVRGLAIDAPRAALHMILRVDVPEGQYLADVGFGNLAPTTALAMVPMIEQYTPHETMRFISMGEELTLQAKLADRWEHIYRVVPYPRFDAEYEIANWYTGTHPQSPYISNLIAAFPGVERTRLTLFNNRLTVRYPDGTADREILSSECDFRRTLAERFDIHPSDSDLRMALHTVEERGWRDGPHPFFA